MRHSIVLILLALSPLCASAQGTSSSSNDLKVTLKAEPGYKKQKRVVKTWSIYPARRVVYNAPAAKGATTNTQPLLVKTYVDPTQKRMPASLAKPVIAKNPKMVTINKVPRKAVKPAIVAKAPVSKEVPARKIAAQKPVEVPAAPETPAVPVYAEGKQPLVLEMMTIKVSKSKAKKVSSLSPYQAGMSRVVRASSPKKSSGLVGRQKIALNK
ncbi:hypothetical protein ACLVWU_02200 [Bdellovibrio sp. HCB290]|uniref:hypothetical protein n=1 Tax=Bdellovibrio sp. HCB290 TaxID=3394356 RepID=UPI0039B54194